VRLMGEVDSLQNSFMTLGEFLGTLAKWGGRIWGMFSQVSVHKLVFCIGSGDDDNE